MLWKGGSIARTLVAGEDGTWSFHGFSQAAANWAQNEGGDAALGSERETSALGRKFEAAVQTETAFAEELGAKAHVFGAVHTPEPELFFVALEKIQGLFQLFHGFVEVVSQVKNAWQPG